MVVAELTLSEETRTQRVLKKRNVNKRQSKESWVVSDCQRALCCEDGG